MENQLRCCKEVDLYREETINHLKLIKRLILMQEDKGRFSGASINEIFYRIHRIKEISSHLNIYYLKALTQSFEDLIYYLCVKKPGDISFAILSVLTFELIDFIKAEADNMTMDYDTERDASILNETVNAFLFVYNEGDVIINNKVEEELYQDIKNTIN
jgi:chemotaxis protein histidine kinase CheA